MSKRNVLLAGAGLFVLPILLYQIAAVNSRVAWRYDVGKTFVRNVLNPVGEVPTAIPNPTSTKSPITPTLPVLVSPTNPVLETPIPPTPTLAPPPAQAALGAPPYEKQAPNNCGPTAIALTLHMLE